MKKTLLIFALLLILAATPFAAQSLNSRDEEPATASKAADKQKGIETIPLEIKGMTCTGCEAPVRKALKKLEGVKGASVSYKKGKAIVEYDPSKVTVEQMIEAVSKAGYKAEKKPGP